MPENSDRISLTSAAVTLGIRYQRARDEMTKGNLGEVIQGENGRYTVDRAAVLRRKAELDAERNSG